MGNITGYFTLYCSIQPCGMLLWFLLYLSEAWETTVVLEFGVPSEVSGGTSEKLSNDEMHEVEK